MEENTYKGKYVDFTIANGIMVGTYKVPVIDLEVAEHATKERVSFVNGVTYPTLADYCSVKATTKEARDYFKTPAALDKLSAIAILINSPIGRIISNFYMKVTKPPIPTEVFSNREAAMEWLEQFVKK